MANIPTVRVTDEQRERIERRAESAKAPNLGAYLKRMAFASNFIPGERVIMERQTIGPNINERRELWVVLTNEEDELEFQCGNDIIVVRRQSDDELCS